MDNVLTTKQKALAINLNNKIYGTFAEIGAGQETVRHFFRSGGASGTIAKAMSAYDKDFSDSIYGREIDSRYVTESRLKRMLTYESDLIEERLNKDHQSDKLFFTYANTVATIDFAKTFKGHGWMGIRFRLHPQEAYSEIMIHVNFKQNDAQLQQETLGMMGVNLIYGSYFHNDAPRKIIHTLYDNIHLDQIEVDTVNFSGSRFMHIDNRLISFELVKKGMTNAVMFGSDGNNILPAQLLYKKNILAMRGSFRPVTKVNVDMLEKGYEAFLRRKNVSQSNLEVLCEITLKHLSGGGNDPKTMDSQMQMINERDFLDRADILCSLGNTVMISNFSEYYKLTEYFSKYTGENIGIIMGVGNLLEVLNEEYYIGLPGGILEAFGKLLSKNIEIFLYPLMGKDGKMRDSNSLEVNKSIQSLYDYFKTTQRIKDLKGVDPNILKIHSRKVLQMIDKNISGWEEQLPEGVPQFIKIKRMFGYKKPVIIKDITPTKD